MFGQCSAVGDDLEGVGNVGLCTDQLRVCLRELTLDERVAFSLAWGWDYANGNFDPPSIEPPTLDDIKAERIAILRAACESAIVDGFTSAALGSPHTYPSDIKAQINLMGSVTDSLIPSLPADWKTPFWVCDEAGSWKWEMHNATQIQQAGRDGKANVVRNQTKLDDLTSAVTAAKTKKAVEAVTW